MVILHLTIAQVSDVLLGEEEEGAIVKHYPAVVLLLGLAHQV